MTSHIHPDREAFDALTQLADDEPVVMLNLLRFRERASYPEGSPHEPCSGREAYARYGAEAVRHVAKVGGKPIWVGDAELTVIGPSDEAWDEVLLVQYPSRKAFIAMASNAEYLACTVHRTAALVDSRLIATHAKRRA